MAGTGREERSFFLKNLDVTVLPWFIPVLGVVKKKMGIQRTCSREEDGIRCSFMVRSPKKVAFTWELRGGDARMLLGGSPRWAKKRKVRGPHAGPEKESPPGRTDLVLPGIEVDLDVAQPLLNCVCIV